MFLDEDRYMIHLGDVLGVPAADVPHVPLHWQTAARVELAVRGLRQKRQDDADARARRAQQKRGR